jgi:hypothetical protein
MSEHTPGPWTVYRDRLRPQFAGRIIEVQSPAGAVVPWTGFDASPFPKGVQYANACLIARAPKLLAQNERLTAEITTLRAEIERLRGALEPFAEQAAEYDTDDTDDMVDWPTFAVGDFRRARAALESRDHG